MNDLLEKTIRDNKEAFDEEPLAGHFDRFEKKLGGKTGKKKKTSWKVYIQIAASVLLAALIINQARIYMSPGKDSDIKLSEISPEYREVEYYYTTSIQSGLNEWNRLVKEGAIGEDEQAMMKQEMQDFDTMYKNLQTELQANPEDERVVNAMLEYYQAKLSIIKLVITKLEEVKQQKLTKNEIEI